MATLTLARIGDGVFHFSTNGDVAVDAGANVLVVDDDSINKEFTRLAKQNDDEALNRFWVDVLGADAGVTFESLALDAAASVTNDAPTFTFSSGGAGDISLRARFLHSSIY